MTSTMVPKTARLWLYSMTYSRENKYKGRYFVKKESSRYKRWQQRCSSTQGGIMDKENHSRYNNAEEKQDNRQLGDIGRNTMKWY